MEQFVTNCAACQAGDKSIKVCHPPLQPVQLPDDPWTQLSLDIAGLCATTPPSKRYLIVMQDYSSKWPEVATCESITTQMVTKFPDKVFSHHGYPLRIVTDNGPQFVSAEYQDYLKYNNITHNRIAIQ